MKRFLIILAAAVLALTACLAAPADRDPADELFEKAMEMLFSENNVTLTATAEFSLNGEWFKTAEGAWKQDGNRSYRQLILRAPKQDGSERVNGYTIVTDGNDLYLMEVYTPGVYRTGTSTGRTTILRPTVETRALRALVEAMTANGKTDLLLGEAAVTKTADGEYRIALDENVPALADAMLNQFVRFAAKRYFSMDYDRMNADSSMSLYHYGTITEGILYTMQAVSLRQAEITVKTDGNSAVQHAEGNIGLYLETSGDGIKQLDVRFQADVTDRGTTLVKQFRPEDYGVEYASGAAESNGAPLDLESDSLNEIEKIAVEALTASGGDKGEVTGIGYRLTENGHEAFIDGLDGWNKEFCFTPDGRLTGLESTPAAWTDAEEYNRDPVPDPKEDEQTKAFLLSFLRRFNPGALQGVKDLKMSWVCDTDGETYAQYDEYPLDQNGGGVTIIVRIRPERTIEFYSCVSNG